MDPLDIIVLILVLGLVGAQSFLLLKQKRGDSLESQNVIQELSKVREEVLRVNFEHRQEIQTQLHRVNDQLFKGMSEQQRSMSDSQKSNQVQFDQMSKIIQEVTTRLITLDTTNKQVLDFSSQLRNLQDILKNPKQRGILGEYFLETALKNVLPPENYKMQYKFLNGEIVDAALLVGEHVIPVDSKFSLENYNKMAEEMNPAERVKLETAFLNDLKNRIIETSKYIRPEEGTLDFAFMFIPHEAVYYDLLVNKIGATEDADSLIVRAASKYRVIIVSPTSFFAYLQTVLQGLRALRIEEQAKDIMQRVSDLGRHFNVFRETHSKMGKNLSLAVSHFNATTGELRKMDKDVARITAGTLESVVEIETVERPTIEA